MKVLEIKGLLIGRGTPKTVVSLMGATAEECLAELDAARKAGADAVEWRADYSSCIHDAAAMVQMGCAITNAASSIPVLFTFRSACEGGMLDLNREEYIALNRAIIEAGIPDLIDIEARIGGDVRTLADAAHARNITMVVSHHDFRQTPSTEWMADYLRKAVSMGADIPKLAVMAQNAEDALRLMTATAQVRREQEIPLLTLAMGREGAITRLVGEQFGSSLTFCALQKTSAPGQVNLERARRIMADLHETLD